ncbi:MAG: hypothetical protein V4697_03620 [Patescibacteria group bacterium]
MPAHLVSRGRALALLGAQFPGNKEEVRRVAEDLLTQRPAFFFQGPLVDVEELARTVSYAPEFLQRTA